MALVAQIERLVGKVPSSVIDEALVVIADILEKDVRIGSSEQATLTYLCKRLPVEYSGPSSRLLDVLEKKRA